MTTKSSRSARRKFSTDAQMSTVHRRTKKDQLIALLRRRGGQGIAQLSEALGWLPHTVRAALTGLRKSGLNVERRVTDDGRTCYRILPKAGR
jgi:predicted ArsR family transcriptional regulator